MGIVTFTLCVCEEKHAQKGEDVPLRLTCGERAGMIACMDGCGGSGARRYPQFGDWTGARVSARLIGNTLADWFLAGDMGARGTGGAAPEALAEQLETLLSSRLKEVKVQIPPEDTAFSSRLSKTLPSTLAAVLVEAAGRNRCRICSFWAGDSRTYFFPVSGLCQTSRDDIRGGADPFDSLMGDGILSNVISADSDFRIHWAQTFTREPCMVLTATDGCLSYFPSPMHLEELLLDTLISAETPLDWENTLREEIGAVAGDDYTLQLAVIGFSNFRALQTAYRPRWEYFRARFTQPLRRVLEENDSVGHRALWMAYKQDYMAEET